MSPQRHLKIDVDAPWTKVSRGEYLTKDGAWARSGTGQHTLPNARATLLTGHSFGASSLAPRPIKDLPVAGAPYCNSRVHGPVSIC